MVKGPHEPPALTSRECMREHEEKDKLKREKQEEKERRKQIRELKARAMKKAATESTYVIVRGHYIPFYSSILTTIRRGVFQNTVHVQCYALRE